MRTYVVGGRYGYFAVDEYSDRGLERTIAVGLTKKRAQEMANALAGAYWRGTEDAKKESQVAAEAGN